VKASRLQLHGLSQVMSDSEALKIGIQVRTGDVVFHGGDNLTALDTYLPFLDCAQQVRLSLPHKLLCEQCTRSIISRMSTLMAST
jgi:hypothetical protein